MGVPKFFRYISERYPCLSEIVREYQIPEFDNLYLDMNGIIHMCSHPDDGNPHFRITEEKIFQDIFHYIEVLFRMIRPQKLFFMAVDGVAPRAKMNQQRGRRFRSAKDAQKQEADAKKKGEKLPEEARFDSNCITPGTVFMARLHEQLKYFVVDKISHDPTWQKCKVILSGHETPGEGEHKIMDYIRYLRAQPGYDPNTRHCLYGLDADLIMLGLCTHEPHFSLLREEVKFGKKSTKRMSVPEEITFYLLHLSLMREYLELEFTPLKDKLEGFEYDLEKIIDDWVLMGFLVGNDFIPHLPNLHIAGGALPVLYKAYMEVLPTLDGYINEAGNLNLARFEKFMEKLSNIDLENFEEIRDDLLYMEAKTGKKWNAHIKVSSKHLEEDVGGDESRTVSADPLQPEKSIDSGLAARIKEVEDMYLDSAEEAEDHSDEDGAFENYKKDYYRNKLEYSNVTPQVMRDQAEGYVRAVQWNLNYYYNGCCSWSWYYPHHYAPYISDIKGFSNLKIEFDLGKPFLPYEQLLAVLPAASKDLLPSCYHYLMVDDNSAIKQYYPEDFQTDLNGKKQEWEAVVLVPFIDENVLLEAMRSCNDYLTTEEGKRNAHGPMMIYTYTINDMGPYPAPEYFSTVTHNHANVATMTYDEVLLPKEKLVKGAYPGVRMDVYYPGFPTMKHLKYKASLKRSKVKVFEHPSRNENMIVSIIPNEKFAGDMIPVDLLGTLVFVGWPHLVEAKVVAISNNKRKYISMGGPNEYNVEERTGHLIPQFKQEVEGMSEYYQRRMGIEVGETNVLVHVQLMIGRKYVFAPNGRLTLEKQFTQNIANYPLQTVVFDISAYDPTQSSVFRDAESVFPKGCTCFTLTNPYYGSQGTVEDSKLLHKNGRIKICISVFEEPDFSRIKELRASIIKSYRTLFHAASQLSMTNLLFSRITGSIYVITKSNEGGLKSVNIGLDLKFNKKNKETPGYTKKIGSTWYYTDKTVDLVRLYSETYPEVFYYLSQDDKRDDINAEWMFNGDCDEKVKEILNWLKNLPVYSLERQTCDSEVIEPEVVEEIEKTVDECPKSGNSKKVTIQIKPNFLYRPEVQNGTLMPDPKTKTRILDRIVNVRSGFTVPLGLKGTVISVHKPADGSERDTMYDVVFDKPFNGGMKLNCSEERGYRLPRTAFINISYGQRLMVEKTGKPDELIAKAEASQANTYNYNSFTNFKAQNYSNNFAPQQYNQYPQQQMQNQQWFPPQYPPEYTSFQQQQSFQKEHSAFAQFAHVAEQRQPLLHPPYNSSIQSQNSYNPDVNSRQFERQNNQQQKYQNNSSNGFFSHQKINNNFMPTFGNTPQPQQESKRQAQQSPQKQQPQQKTDENKELPARNQNENVRPKCNTEYLRRLLKIDNVDKRNKENKQSDLNTDPLASTSQKDTPKEEKTDDISFDMFAQAAQEPASVRLLTYYQSNGLGLPRYQYFNCENLIQSQMTLASGDVIIGKPAMTREEASENVAADALEVFMKKAKTDSDNTRITEGFPTPPKTWVQSQSIKENNQDDKDEQEVSVPVDNSQTTTANKSKSDTTLLNNSLVPLQAIARHRNKVNNTSNRQVVEGSSFTKNVAEKQINIEVSNTDNKNIQNIQDHATLQKEKKGRGRRRTRIAANFSWSKNK